MTFWIRIQVSLTLNLLIPLYHPVSKETNKKKATENPYTSFQRIIYNVFVFVFVFYQNQVQSGSRALLNTWVLSCLALLKYKKHIHKTALLGKKPQILPTRPQPSDKRGQSRRNITVLNSRAVTRHRLAFRAGRWQEGHRSSRSCQAHLQSTIKWSLKIPPIMTNVLPARQPIPRWDSPKYLKSLFKRQNEFKTQVLMAEVPVAQVTFLSKAREDDTGCDVPLEYCHLSLSLSHIKSTPKNQTKENRKSQFQGTRACF